MHAQHTIRVQSVSALVDALGGRDAAATALKATQGQIDVWKHRGRIPARHYLHHHAVAAERGISADAALWNQSAGADQ